MILAILALLLLQLPPANPTLTQFTVTLQWDANTETDLAGYRVYYGQTSRAYGTPIAVGLVTTYQVKGLTTPGVYYFAVTALNTAGQESGFSNEATMLIAKAGDIPIGPILSQAVSGLTTTTATISWVTRTDCSGKVNYGTVDPLSSMAIANNLGTTDHLVTIIGLIPRTHYHYQVSGVCGGTAIQGEVKSFNTK